MIEATAIKQRRKRTLGGKDRGISYYHFLSVNGKKIKVCLHTFLTVHAISADRLRRIKKLLCSNDIPQDKRGKHPKGNAISDEVQGLIREHINLFPTKQSHYSGRDYYYLDARLNIKIMYNLFCSKYPNSAVSYYYYRKFFYENFDLHFGRPQIDTCNKCEEFTLKIKSSRLGETEKRIAIGEKLVHERRAKKFYRALKDSEAECKQRDDLGVISFDYMQNLHLPLIPVQDVFYLTQLTVSVFGIHDLKSGKAYFYLYTEDAAGKSPNEVCSFLTNFLENYVPKDITELRMFSDNCPGQNKNHCLIRLCAALVDSGRFKKIEQNFPIRGHSYLPCDRDFALIKRNLKKYDRIYDLHEYTEIIVSSGCRNKFTVHEIHSENNTQILDFKSWWPTCYKRDCTSEETQHNSRENKQNFSILKFHHFIHDCSKPGVVRASEYINGFIWHSFHITHAKKAKSVFPLQFPKSPAYRGPLPILQSKLEHLKTMLEWVPEENKTFYQKIVSGNAKQRKQSISKARIE